MPVLEQRKSRYTRSVVWVGAIGYIDHNDQPPRHCCRTSEDATERIAKLHVKSAVLTYPCHDYRASHGFSDTAGRNAEGSGQRPCVWLCRALNTCGAVAKRYGLQCARRQWVTLQSFGVCDRDCKSAHLAEKAAATLSWPHNLCSSTQHRLQVAW